MKGCVKIGDGCSRISELRSALFLPFQMLRETLLDVHAQRNICAWKQASQPGNRFSPVRFRSASQAQSTGEQCEFGIPIVHDVPQRWPFAWADTRLHEKRESAPPLPQARFKRLAAECLGTGLLVTTVVGSGIMGERLAGGNVALAVLGNTLPTGAILVALILALGPISGAHFNPVVSLVMSLRKDHPWREFFPYAGAQIVGGCLGTLVAHGMFELPLFELTVKARTGPAQWFAEFVATFGLIVTILAVSRFKSEAIPVAVGLYITAAYWFTASTSFANPAVTIARALTNSFSGIAPADVPMFIVAQLVGALAGLGLMRWFFIVSPPRTVSAVKRAAFVP